MCQTKSVCPDKLEPPSGISGMLDHPQVHPMFCPRAITVVPGSPYKKIPIRLNLNEKSLTIIGLDQG